LSTEAITWAPSLWARYQLALAELQMGALDAAERTVNLAARTYPGDVLCYPVRGLIAARRGQADEADRQIALTIRNQKAFGHYHHAQYDVACIHALLGRTDRALEWLHDGAHNGFPCAAFFEQDPLLASIREEPRFEALMCASAHGVRWYARLYARAYKERSARDQPRPGVHRLRGGLFSCGVLAAPGRPTRSPPWEWEGYTPAYIEESRKPR
jgi:tetratricopeptide (TPR) repeat protein